LKIKKIVFLGDTSYSLIQTLSLLELGTWMYLLATTINRVTDIRQMADDSNTNSWQYELLKMPTLMCRDAEGSWTKW